MTALQRLRHCHEVLGRGPADRLQRHHLRPDRRRRRLRRRRRDRQDPLAVRGEARPEDQHGLLRLAEPRRRARRRQGLLRPARRQARRPRPEDRRGRSGDRGRSTGRRATRSRPRRCTTTALYHGHLGRRVRHPRPRDGARRQDRQGGLALLHHPGPRRDRPRDLAADHDAWKHGGAPVWQTPAVDPELGLLYFSTGNASPDLDGSSAPATTSSPPRSSRSTRRPASTAGTSSRCTTTSGTTTPRARPCSSTRGGRQDRASASPGRQDRLALHARPRDRQAAHRRSRRSRCRRAPAEDIADAAVPDQPAVRPARVTDEAFENDQEAVAREREAQGRAASRATSTIFTPSSEHDDGHRHAGPAGWRRTGSRRATTRRRT